MSVDPYQTPTARVADVSAVPANTVEVTWGRAAKVWWSFIWRAVLFGIIAGAVMGGVVGGIMGASGAAPTAAAGIVQLIGTVVAIPIGIWVTRTVLRKSWSDFRIVLVAK